MSCTEHERDFAGSHVLDGFLKDACKLIQAAPFCEEAWPEFLLWKCAVFQEWKRSGIWERWCSMQKGFCESLVCATKALRHPAYGMIGTNYLPEALVVNQWFEHKVKQEMLVSTMLHNASSALLLVVMLPSSNTGVDRL